MNFQQVNTHETFNTNISKPRKTPKISSPHYPDRSLVLLADANRSAEAQALEFWIVLNLYTGR